MENTNWFKQEADKPLFPDLLWSRPENRLHAGKLLIIGGNKFAVSAPGVAYSAAQKAGAGTVRVLLPDSTKKLVGKIFPEAEFAPSTPSGSFAREALAQLLESAQWSDGVLLAGDFGRNSETAILLENFAEKYKGQLTIAQDGVDYFLHSSSPALNRENTTFVINLGKLQKLAKNNRPTTPVLHSMTLSALVSVLQDWTNSAQANFITKHADTLLAANCGRASTTPYKEDIKWQVELAVFAAVWWLQQPQKPFEALTTAVYDYSKNAA
jgi:NAD(P)H-hydrate repair Nnr-like enzyme with NAD(P)H-hydrate dehydratase domain